jgi:signal peptidase I
MDSFKPEKDLLRELGYRLLTEGKVLRVRADGYSMYPQIKPGAFLLIEPVGDVSSLKESEIIACKRNTSMVVHRLIRIEHSENQIIYFTRGDSCLWEDEALNSNQIVGRVTGIFTGEKFEKKNPVQTGTINYRFNSMKVKLLLVRDKIRSIFDY